MHKGLFFAILLLDAPSNDAELMRRSPVYCRLVQRWITGAFACTMSRTAHVSVQADHPGWQGSGRGSCWNKAGDWTHRVLTESHYHHLDISPICGPNIWLAESLPELDGAFKELGRLMMEVAVTSDNDFYGNPHILTCRPNVWPGESLPKLETAFKELGRLMMEVGLRLTEHCDRYVAAHSAAAAPDALQQILLRSPCPKVTLRSPCPSLISFRGVRKTNSYPPAAPPRGRTPFSFKLALPAPRCGAPRCPAADTASLPLPQGALHLLAQ